MSGPPPPVDADTAGWWDATRERRLVVQECLACGALQHPPRPLCLTCGGVELGWREVGGGAQVDAWTVVHRSAGPGFDPPYVLARVRLDEGPLLLSRLDGPPGHRCGERVRLTWSALPDGRHLPVFTALDPSAPNKD